MLHHRCGRVSVGMDFREHILAAVAESGLSERKLSVLATGSTDTIRNIRRGTVPRVTTLEALCRVLGLELQIRRGSVPEHEKAARTIRPATEFSGSHELPVYEWEGRTSEDDYRRRLHDNDRAPAPVDLGDEQAFYLRMPDDSMVPARIGKHEYCLVSPCAKLQVDQRAWFRSPTGREAIKWVMRLSAAGYDLGSWTPDDVWHQKPTCERWSARSSRRPWRVCWLCTATSPRRRHHRSLARRCAPGCAGGTLAVRTARRRPRGRRRGA